MPGKVTSRMVVELLKIKHSGMEWAHFTELNQGTGGRMGRRIDFYAFNVWPSKGYNKIAYEIKLSRADFARELDDPTKRAFSEKVANECYFVTPMNLVQPTEVPQGWGLYEVNGNGLRRKLMATQRKVDDLPLDFMASMARVAGEPDSELPAAVWLLDGQELTVADLEKAAGERTQEIVDRRLREQQNKHWEELRKAQEESGRFINLIRHKLGWEYGDYESFSRWLDKQEVKLSHRTLRIFRDAHEEIGNILKNQGET